MAFRRRRANRSQSRLAKGHRLASQHEVLEARLVFDLEPPCIELIADLNNHNTPEKPCDEVCSDPNESSASTQGIASQSGVPVSFTGDLAWNGAGLDYLADTSPSTIVRVLAEIDTEPGIVPGAARAEWTIDGVAQSPIYYDTDGMALGDKISFSYMVHDPNRATGHYPYSLTVYSYNDQDVVVHTSTISGKFDFVNRYDSPLGRGRWIDGLDELYVYRNGSDVVTGALLVRTDDTTAWFDRIPDTTIFVSPDGRYQELKIDTGLYVLTHADGTVDTFNVAAAGSVGLATLRSRVTADLQRLDYTYNSGKLTTIEDTFDRATTLAYDGTSGKLTTITDWAGRVTTFDVASGTGGVLESITLPDPDGPSGPQAAPVTSFEYNSTSGLLEEINEPGGRTTEIEYGFARRVSKITNPDGSEWNLEPAFARAVVDLTSVGYDLAHAAPAEYLALGNVTELVDEEGETTTYRVDQYGLPLEVTNANEHTITFERDVNGHLTSLVQPRPGGGEITTGFTVDARGSVTTATYDDSLGQETWEYYFDDPFHRSWVVAYVDELGNRTEYDRAANGTIQRIRQIVGTEDTFSNLVDDFMVSYTWNSTYPSLLTSEVDASGRSVTYTYNTTTGSSKAGQVLTVTVGNGGEASTTTYDYDSKGRRTVMVDGLGRRTEWVYDDLDRLIAQKEPNPDSPSQATGPLTRYEYDARGNRTKMIDPLGRVTTYAYDVMNRLEEQTDPDPDGAAGPLASPVTEYTYWGTGKVKTVTDPHGQVTSYAYDGMRQLEQRTDPDPDGVMGPQAAPVTVYGYDELDNLASISDALGHTTNYAYDARSRLIEEQRPDVDPSGAVVRPTTTYEYYLDGQLKKVIDPLDRETAYEYDLLGRLVKLTEADPDGPSNPKTSPITRYAYDRSNNLTRVIDPRGTETHYEFDSLNRPTRTLYSAPGTTPYDATQEETAATYTGQTSTGTGGHGGNYRTVTPNLPTAGTVATAKWTFTGLTSGKTYQAMVTYPANFVASPTVTYAAKPAGSGTVLASTVVASQQPIPADFTDQDGYNWDRLFTFTATSTSIDFWATLNGLSGNLRADAVRIVEVGAVSTTAYDLADQVTSETNENGKSTTYVYDGLGRMTKVTEPDPDGAGSTYQSPITEYQYDAVGNVVGVIDPRDGYTVGSFRTYVTRYVYDNLDRPVNVLEPAPNPSYNPAWIGKDDEDSGVTQVGTWNETTGAGYLSDYRVSTPSGTNTMTYAFTGLVSGKKYALVADWVPLSTNSSAVPYIVKDGSTTIATVNIDQQLAPSGFYDPSVDYGKILGVFDHTSGTLSVTISANVSSGNVVADGIYLLEVGPTTTNEYDEMGQLVSVVDPLARTTAYDYDHLGRLVKMTGANPNGPGIDTDSPVTRYEYDAVGNLVMVVDPRQSQFPWQNPRQAADVDGDGEVTSADEDLIDDYITLHGAGALPAAGGADGPPPYYDVNGDNQITTADSTIVAAAIVNDHNQPWDLATLFVYDPLNRLLEVREPSPSGQYGSASVTAYAYDVADQVTSITDPTGYARYFAYDNLGRRRTMSLTDPDGGGPLSAAHYNVDYDAVGNLTAAADPLSHTTSYAYDRRNRLTTMSDPLSGSTSYTYDAHGNQLTLTDPSSNTTTWVYDALNRPTTETNQLSQARTFSYDAASNLTKQVDRNGRERRFTFDRLDNVTDEKWYNGVTLTRTLSYTVDNRGQVTATSDSDTNTPSAYAFTYDNLGRELTNARLGVTLTSAYDANGNRTSLDVGIATWDDLINNYTYDRQNRLIDLQQGQQSGGSAVAAKRVKLEYDAADRLTKESRYKDSAATQLVFDTTHEYFPVGWHKSQSSKTGPSTEIAGYSWTYDLAGRMDTFTVNSASYSTAENVTDYTYDNLDQLTAADRSGTTNDESYGFNSAGNRNAGGFTATTNNRYSAVSIGGVTYTPAYDNEGNLTSLTRTGTNQDIIFTYDYRNRLTSYVTRTAGAETKHVDFWYDVFDRRVKMAVDPDGAGATGWTTTYWWHDGQNPLLEIDAGTNSITHRYLYGNAVDQVFADERYAPGGGNQPTSGGALRLPIADHLNTTRDLVDSTGAVINHIAYDSFGQVKSETNGAIDYLFGFGGFERDEATGMLHSDTRYYHPALGRWISEDPLGFAGGDANLVRYVGNGPTNATDPTGLIGWLDNYGYYLRQNVTTVGSWFSAGGNAVRSGAESVAGNWEDVTESTGSATFGAIGAYQGSLIRSLGGIGGGIVDLPGSFRAAVNDFAVTKAYADRFGWSVAANRQLGSLSAIEAAYGVDIWDERELESDEQWERAADAAGRAGSAAGMVAGGISLGRGVLGRFKQIKQPPGAASAFVDDCPDVPIKGGSYENVRKANEGGDVHHTPADSVSPIPKKDGPALHMETPDHVRTASFGGSREARKFRELQRQLIQEGKFMEAVQLDIDDLVTKFGDKYAEAIRQMREYAETFRDGN